MEESVVEKLKRVGLTEYEAKAYLCLLRNHLNSATKLSKKSGVPRTKIYSRAPLLFRAVDPSEVFDRIKRDYEEFLESIQTTLSEEVTEMKDKFVIKKFDLGLKGLKEEIRKAKPSE